MRDHSLRCTRVLLLCAALAAARALAQQKTGPGITGEESLTWKGITLYGVIDVGVQYDTHMAPFTPFRPAASGNIVRPMSRESVVGVSPSNMGQSRVGLQGIEPLAGDWAALFQVETFFNPQSGEIANSLKSLTVNNGVPLSKQSVGVDGSSAGQALQTSWVGLKSPRFGTLTFGRQVTLLLEGVIEYDPNYNAAAFGLLGASNSYSGGGSQESNRLDSTLKYRVSFNELWHLGALYKLHGASGSANTAWQGNIGADLAHASVDGYYSRVNSAITATSLSASQLARLPPAYSAADSVAATISDNTAYALMAVYKLEALRLFAGYEHIRYENPRTPSSPGFVNIGGYVLAFVNNSAYDNSRSVQVYWTGVRYRPLPRLDLTAAWYGVHQGAYGSGALAGCASRLSSSCSGSLEAFSFDADYRFNLHFDAYVGAMYSGVHDGMANGYPYYTTNINPTIGVRYRF